MSAEVHNLLGRCRENIRACEHLIDQGFYAIAASRAYYAIFYAAEALLINEGFQFSSHGAVHAAFGQRLVKTGRVDPKFHRYILDAFRSRQTADYDALPEVSETGAQEMLAQAREFLSMAEQVLGEESS